MSTALHIYEKNQKIGVLNLTGSTWFSARVSDVARSILVVLEVNLSFRWSFHRNRKPTCTRLPRVDVEMTYSGVKAYTALAISFQLATFGRW